MGMFSACIKSCIQRRIAPRSTDRPSFPGIIYIIIGIFRKLLIVSGQHNILCDSKCPVFTELLNRCSDIPDEPIDHASSADLIQFLQADFPGLCLESLQILPGEVDIQNAFDRLDRGFHRLTRTYKSDGTDCSDQIFLSFFFLSWLILSENLPAVNNGIAGVLTPGFSILSNPAEISQNILVIYGNLWYSLRTLY